MTPALDSIAEAVGWAPEAARLRIIDSPQAIATPHPVADIATAAYGALALAAAEYASGSTPVVNRGLASLALAGNEYLRVEDGGPETWDPITGYYRCADGWLYLHGNFPHLRDGLLRLFGAGNDKADMIARLAPWRADEAEEAAQSAGLCCMKRRDRAAWEAHPQRAALGAHPLVRISEIHPPRPSGAAPRARRSAPQAGSRPLSGVRVLDLSRVIAGPMAGRALAELGAEVLRISAPGLPHIPPLVIDTGFGKRAAHADLSTTDGRAALRALIADADILIDGFRPGALAAKGFGAEDLAAINPEITVATLSAFSDTGPWAGRRGYDTYVQAAIGLTTQPSPEKPPVRLPCQPLDYLTGCLTAFGAIRALTARRAAGGARIVETSLARTAMWVWEMSDRIGPATDAPTRNMIWDEADRNGWIRRMDSAHGRVAALAPPYGFRENPLNWTAPPARLGAHKPEWRA